MKKLILLLGLLVASPVFSQPETVDDLFNHYAMQDGFTSVTVSKGALDLLAVAEQDDELREMSSSIQRIRILACEGRMGKSMNMDFYNKLLPKIPVNDYKELMHSRSARQDVIILVKENNGVIKDLLLLLGGEDNALILIQGNIDLKNLSKLSATIPGSGFHHLGKTDLQKVLSSEVKTETFFASD